MPEAITSEEKSKTLLKMYKIKKYITFLIFYCPREKKIIILAMEKNNVYGVFIYSFNSVQQIALKNLKSESKSKAFCLH